MKKKLSRLLVIFICTIFIVLQGCGSVAEIQTFTNTLKAEKISRVSADKFDTAFSGNAVYTVADSTKELEKVSCYLGSNILEADIMADIGKIEKAVIAIAEPDYKYNCIIQYIKYKNEKDAEDVFNKLAMFNYVGYYTEPVSIADGSDYLTDYYLLKFTTSGCYTGCWKSGKDLYIMSSMDHNGSTEGQDLLNNILKQLHLVSFSEASFR